MKFKDLFLFLEQEDDDELLDVDPWDQMDANANEPAEPNQPQNPQPLDPNGDDPIENQPRKLSAKEQIKQKWLRENPAIDNDDMEEAIGFFQNQRPRLRPYHPFGYVDPQTNRHYINIPELTAIVLRFPRMEEILSDKARMNDIKNYPWEVMSFWRDILQQNNTNIDAEATIPGVTLPYEEQLNLAKETFKETKGLIVNEGGVMVHRIESKNESIKYGSIQRVLSIERRKTYTYGNMYWCITVPLNDTTGRSNLWTNYRPKYGFYFLWDQNKPERDSNYFVAIRVSNEGYSFVDLYNQTTTSIPWETLVGMFPVLRDKRQLFRHFGTTPKEREDFTLDKITMSQGSPYYFGTIAEVYQHAYVESGRHVNDPRAFLTMRPPTRKLYVDKTSKLNNDIKDRFRANGSDPYAILKILEKERKPEDLYKHLDKNVLKTRENIPEGILSIKRLILGDDFKTTMMDPDNGYMLSSKRGKTLSLGGTSVFGILDIDNIEVIKDFKYKLIKSKTYLNRYTEDGIERRKLYIHQIYEAFASTGLPDTEDRFSFICLKEALSDKSSPLYMKGKFFDGNQGDEYIQEGINAGKLMKM